MKQQLEIERKFTLTHLPDDLIIGVQGDEIKQGYLLRENDRELRIRKRNQENWMTLKQGSGLSRFEQECSIPSSQFEMLWPLTEGQRVEKTRYTVKQQDFLFEIDLFKGDLEPLVMLEVEFENLQKSREFLVPTFVSREVTEDKDYKNATLASNGLPDSFARSLMISATRKGTK